MSRAMLVPVDLLLSSKSIYIYQSSLPSTYSYYSYIQKRKEGPRDIMVTLGNKKTSSQNYPWSIYLAPTNILEPFFILFANCSLFVFKKGLITFLYSESMFSFWKWVSEWASISKMWFFFEMCFHFQNVKSFVSVVFPFSEKHNCKQKFVNKICTGTTNSFTDKVVKKPRNIYML